MKGNVFLIALAFFIVSLIVTLNIFLQETYQAKMAEQFNQQQLLLAGTISRNLENTFEHLEDELLSLARLLEQEDLQRTERVRTLVETAFEELRQEVELTLKVYFAGRLLYASRGQEPSASELTLLRHGCGELPPGEVLSQNLVSSEGLLRLCTPIKGTQGALLMNVFMDSINQLYIAPMKIGKRGHAWIMDEGGTLLFHPTQPEMVGRNLHEAASACYGCHRSFETELWILKAGQEGASSYIAPFGEDKLIAFSRAQVLGQEWIVCVSTPYSEVTEALRKSLLLHSAIIFTIFGAAVLGAGAFVVINKRRIQAEERARHEEELQAYAAQLERTVAERTKELYAEKEKLDTIVNAMGAGLVLMEPDGRVQWANRSFLQMVGTDDIVGKHCEQLCQDCSMVHSMLSDQAETNVIKDLFGKKDRYFQVTTVPLKSEGELVGYIRLVQDVTDMKRMEEQMAHSEKLAALGRLTAGIAHEIGNPLTSVFSFLQILRDMEKEEFKKQSLETVLSHMRRIADIVRQLSSLSKLPQPMLKPVDVNAVLRQALELMHYDKRAKNITVVEELHESIPQVVADENQLAQVFINLVLNAVDAMPQGGTLTVCSRAMPDRVIVEVKDTGVGIEAEDLPRIFDPFFTTKDSGTGLGLAVSYGIIQRLGGDIKVESQKGLGSKFTVIIPIGRQQKDG